VQKRVHAAAHRPGQFDPLSDAYLHAAFVVGAVRGIITVYGRPVALMAFTVTEGKIVEIDAVATPNGFAGSQQLCSMTRRHRTNAGPSQMFLYGKVAKTQSAGCTKCGPSAKMQSGGCR